MKYTLRSLLAGDKLILRYTELAMKMELLSLRLVGAGPLKDVTLDFSDGNGSARPVTLIAGANGSGKTTVLEAIYNVSATLPTIRLSSTVSSRARTNLAIYDFIEMTIKIDDSIAAFTHGRSRFWRSSDKVDEQSAVPTIPLGFADVTNSSALMREHEAPEPVKNFLHRLRTNRIITGATEANKPISNNRIGLQIPNLLYLPYLRRLSNAKGDSIVREYTRSPFAYKYDLEVEYVGSLNSYLVWLDYAEPKMFIESAQFIENIYDNKKHIEIDRRRLKAIVRTDNDETHDIEYLSSGEQNLLIILLELQRRLTPHSIVLIDEIENSLHPKYQYKLGQMLKTLQQRTPFQLVATTHAPAFLDIFGAENTLILTDF